MIYHNPRFCKSVFAKGGGVPALVRSFERTNCKFDPLFRQIEEKAARIGSPFEGRAYAEIFCEEESFL